MFRCVFPSVKCFAHIVNTLSAFEDTNWELRAENGIYVNAMDGTHTTLVEVRVPAGAFGELRVDEPTVLGISARMVSEFLKSAPGGTELVLGSVTGTGAKRARVNPDRVALSIRGGRVSLDAEIVLLDIDVETLDVPEAEWNTVLRMPCALLVDICKCLRSVSDTVRVTVRDGALEFHAAGVTGTVTMPVETDAEKGTLVEGGVGEFMLEFSVTYMQQFAAAGSHSSGVSLSLSPDLPALVELDVKDLEGSTIRFWMAPRVSNE